MERMNRIIATVIFLFTTIIYMMTVAPTTSFWDCGEFIACSYKMAVPHPPGAPLYLLVGRFFTLLPIPLDTGLKVNLISVFSSAITIMLLYLIIVHLVRQWKGGLNEKSDWLIAMFSGVIGALTFAFTHSFWFNAGEAEVYAPSMLFTSLIVWLILVWSQKSEEPGNEKYLFIIAYLVGLAIAVHLLNVLALPFVAMIFYYKRFQFNWKTFLYVVGITMVVMIVIYPGMVKWVPHLALNFGVMGLLGLFLVLLLGAGWSIKNKKHISTLIFVSLLLIAIGYSTYATIYIRSNLDPMIDENNPETIENFISYIEREQYGQHSVLDREGVWKSSQNSNRYDSVWDFFWTYQVNYMYVRYFMWQFVGMADDETNVSVSQFWALPLLLGLLGLYWHFRNDPKNALAVFALFFMTGLAIILYLNQPDPQPRERDYSYVGSFFAFSIWIGLGYAGVLELIRSFVYKEGERLKPMIKYVTFVILLLAVPVHMLAKNYHTHDRSGNYVAWDYSYNMLMSCEPDAILITNGDNDTFPLWYLQEVEGIRTDVRIVNLSLLNTDWYIKQLRDLEPTVPMHMPDVNLERIGLQRWETQNVTVDVPKEVAREARTDYARQFARRDIALPDKISFKVEPSIKTQYGSAIRVQDYMVLNILAANRWRKPIYFAVTVPQSNLLSELQDYLRMDGLVQKVVPYKNWMFSPQKLEENLIDVYRYRNLANPDVYYNHEIKSLLQNYRSAFIRLAQYYVQNDQKDKVMQVLDTMDKKIAPDVIPMLNRRLLSFRQAFYIIADSTYIDSVLNKNTDARTLGMIGENLLRTGHFDPSVKIAEAAYELNPSSPRTLSMLINAYRMTNQEEKAIKPLERWLERRPEDKNAQRLLRSFKSKIQNE